MCCCGSRVGSIAAGIFFLIEALLWLALSVVGLVAYNCKINIRQDISSIIYYIYFYNGACHEEFPMDPDYTTPEGFTFPPDFTIPTIWPDVVEPSERTQRWVFAYLILSGVWAFTSLILIVGSCVGCKGLHAIWYYLPCVLSTLAVIVADTVASVIYGLDIAKTENVEDLMKFIGMYDPDGKILDELNADLGDKSSFTPVPSIVMLLIFCRGLILWIINLVVFIQLFVAMVKTMRHKRQKSKLPSNEVQRKDSTESDDDWSFNRSSKKSFRGFGKSILQRRKSNGEAAQKRAQEQEAEDAENNKDFNRVLSNHNEVRSSLRENGMPPTELRSQLPWSYFSSRDEPARPPKPTIPTKELMPPVPPPDYTLRFPQTTRPSLTLQNQPVVRSNSHNSVERGPAPNHPHGRDLAGATPVFPQVIRQDYSQRRIPPEVPHKSTNMRMFSGGSHSNWIRKAPEVPSVSSLGRKDGPSPVIPEPDYSKPEYSKPEYSNPEYSKPEYSKPATVPIIPPPDYSNPVGSDRGAVWRQKPLHTAPLVITRTPLNKGRTNENGYY